MTNKFLPEDPRRLSRDPGPVDKLETLINIISIIRDSIIALRAPPVELILQVLTEIASYAYAYFNQENYDIEERTPQLVIKEETSLLKSPSGQTIDTGKNISYRVFSRPPKLIENFQLSEFFGDLAVELIELRRSIIKERPTKKVAWQLLTRPRSRKAQPPLSSPRKTRIELRLALEEIKRLNEIISKQSKYIKSLRNQIFFFRRKCINLSPRKHVHQ